MSLYNVFSERQYLESKLDLNSLQAIRLLRHLKENKISVNSFLLGITKGFVQRDLSETDKLNIFFEVKKEKQAELNRIKDSKFELLGHLKELNRREQDILNLLSYDN